MRSTRPAWVWALLALAVLLAGVLVGRALLARKAVSAEAPRTAAVLELAPADVARAEPRELVRRLDITGELRAVDSAVVKARVAAEVRELTVREGDRVVAGQVLGRLDATEYALRLRQAEQQAAQASAQLQIAERALDNNRALVDQGFISKNALDTSVSNAASARAALQAARASADLARKAEADTVLRAPIAGLVSQRLVQPGERVPVDARLIEIVNLSRIELEAALAPEDVGQVRIGALARLQVDGLTEPVSARVARINPSAQVGTRAVMVYLEVEPVPALRQGLFATGRIELERRSALAVPASAVRIDQAQPYVLALADGRIVAHTVSLGTRGDGGAGPDGSGAAGDALVEVTEGLPPGSVVLRGSVGAVRAGSAARVTTLPAVAPAASASSAAAAR